MEVANETPLVSLLVYNYNYGRYLEECFDSILGQTYTNIELIFSDNASDDTSWEIACRYQRNNPGKMFIARNKENLGTDANLRNCLSARRGSFYCVIGSDDVLDPNFVSYCVKAFHEEPDIHYVMTHRFIIDENSKRTEEASFYDGSYVLYPPSQCSVYMMAAINPTISQIMYRKGADFDTRGVFNGQFYAARILDFMITLRHAVAYIDKPLLGHRIHGDNQSLVANKNLMEIIGAYVLTHQFVELARPFGYGQVSEKYEDAIRQTSRLSLRYAGRAFLTDDEILFRKYLHLAQAISPEVCNDKGFKILNSFNGKNAKEVKETIKNEKQLEFARKRSYAPNPPFKVLNI